MDWVVILGEVLHKSKKTKQEGVILKLDFEACYRVSWKFLEEVLIQKGFSQVATLGELDDASSQRWKDCSGCEWGDRRVFSKL